MYLIVLSVSVRFIYTICYVHQIFVCYADLLFVDNNDLISLSKKINVYIYSLYMSIYNRVPVTINLRLYTLEP